MTAHDSTLLDPVRLAALRDAALLDQPPAEALDRLTRVASRILHAPMALLTLLDAEREFFESTTGIPEPWTTRREMPLEYSFCRYIVSSGRPLLIDDTRRSELVRDSPAIRELNIVAFAGVPLRASDGEVLGALCVADRLPRAWTDEEVEVLTDLAAVAEGEIGQRVARTREQRRGREALGKMEEKLAAAGRFRLLVEQSLAGIYLVQDERILYVNPRMGELFGYPSEQMISRMRVSDLVAEADRDLVREQLRRRLEGEVDSVRYTFRGVRSDGRVIDVEVHGSRTEVGGRPAVVGTLLDVTQRKRAEAALRASEERLRLVERATEDVIWEWSVRAGTVAWNEAGARILRYTPQEVGATVDWHYQRIHPDDRERVIGRMHSVLSGVGEFWSDEYRFLRGDGAYATVLDRAYVVRDQRGTPLRVIGSMMDVTERKRAEEAQRFLSRASALLDDSLDCEATLGSLARLCVPALGDCCVIDLVEEDGALSRVATAHVDPRAERMLLSREASLLPGADGSVPALQVVRTGESLFLPQCDPPGEDGVEACSLMVVPLVAAERVLGAMSFASVDPARRYTTMDLMLAQDLAHRTAHAVDHARLYSRATQAVLARDEVLGVVSHDLRNPLHTILMSAVLLRDGNERRSDNQKWLDVIGRAADEMRALIEDLLDVSNIEAGRFPVDRARRDPGSLVGDAHALMEPLAREKSIRLESRVEEGLPTVWMDDHQILRVLSNLVGNAIKFTPEGGRVELSVEGRGDEVLFSVLDTGPGIPGEYLEHVFDRYWQGRPGDRRGVGLGLAIARGIVDAHAGRIWVESVEGNGSVFRFTLPAGVPARREEEVAVPA